MAARDGELDQAWFRTDRFIRTTNPDSAWFVSLREGMMLGPFDSRREAEIELVLHLREQGVALTLPGGDDLDLDWFLAR
jgi:hypothetical protein